MHGSIESLTTTALSLALDAASLRQQVLAANIANAGQPARAAQRVHFEALLGGPTHRGAPPRLAAPWSAADVELRVRLVPDRAQPGGEPQPVQLDAEIAALSRNALHYTALVKGIGKHMAVLALAVSEGRR